MINNIFYQHKKKLIKKEKKSIKIISLRALEIQTEMFVCLYVIYQKGVRVLHQGIQTQETDESTRPSSVSRCLDEAQSTSF